MRLSPRGKGKAKREKERCRDQAPRLCASVCVCVCVWSQWCERKKGWGTNRALTVFAPKLDARGACGLGGWGGGGEGVAPAEL